MFVLPLVFLQNQRNLKTGENKFGYWWLVELPKRLSSGCAWKFQISVDFFWHFLSSVQKGQNAWNLRMNVETKMGRGNSEKLKIVYWVEGTAGDPIHDISSCRPSWTAAITRNHKNGNYKA